MNAMILFLLAGLISSAWASGQEPIRSPAKPPAANAGRVVPLQHTWRIKDAGDGYFLTNPARVAFGPDGTLFVQDVNKILRFDAAGKFLRAYKPESASGSFLFMGLDVAGDSVVTFEMVGRRVYVFDLQTGAERGFRLPMDRAPAPQFLFSKNGRLYFADSQRIFAYSMEGNPDGQEIPFGASQASLEERATRSVVTATVRAAPLGASEALLCTTFEYLVRRLDLAGGKTVGAFTRDYVGVRNENESTRALAPNKLDIGGLQVVGDRLWVFTSTHDSAKGTLVDVFDLQGRYLDNFYLQVKDGEKVVPLGFNPKATSGRDIVMVVRNGTEFRIEKFTVPLAV